MKKLALLLLLGAAFGQQQQHQQLTGTIPVSGGSTVNLQDTLGTTSHSFAAWQTNGTVTSPSLTVYGCVRNPVPGQAGACTSMGTIATLGTPSTYTGAYDYFYVTGTWTGSGQVYITESDTIARVNGGGSSGVASINGTTGAFTFTGSGVSCSGTTCTFTGGSTGVTSYNTRTGAVTPASGDYTVAQVTGAAPLASPTFTGTVTIPNGGLSGLISCSNLPADTAGDLTSASGTCSDTVVGINGQNLAALGAGIYKFNASGVPALAVANTDYTTPSGSITGTAANITGVAAVVNGGTGAATAALARTNLNAQVANIQVSDLWCIGDSYCAGLGAPNEGQDSMFSMLSRDTPASPHNQGIVGATVATITTNAMLTYYRNPYLQSVIVNNGGENDSVSCSSATASCGLSFGFQLSALEAYESIPDAYRIYTYNATTSGTWSVITNQTLALGSPPVYLLNPGYPESAATSGATATFSIPSSTATKVGITYFVATGNTGAFTVSVDGTNVTDAGSASTTFSSAPVSSTTPAVTSSGTFYRQEYPVTAGTSHTVVVTLTAAATAEIGWVDYNAAATTANLYNPIFDLNVIALPIWANYAVWNTVKSTIDTQLKADGLPVYYVDLVNGTPGVNTTTDVSLTATKVCPAATYANHPNRCGYFHMEQTIYNAEVANSVIFSQPALTPRIYAWDGLSTTSMNTQQNAAGYQGTHNQVFGTPCGSALAGGAPCGFDFYRPTGGGVSSGIGVYQDQSSGNAWSSKFVEGLFSPSSPVFWTCFGLSTAGGNSTDANSSYTTKACIDDTTGYAHIPQIIGTGTPTYAINTTYAGSGATVVATTGASNTDSSGRITLTTGTGTTASGTLATISFGGTHATPFQVCVLQAIGANANGQVAMVAPTFPTTTSWTIAVAGSAIPASTTYTYGYICQ